MAETPHFLCTVGPRFPFPDIAGPVNGAGDKDALGAEPATCLNWGVCCWQQTPYSSELNTVSSWSSQQAALWSPCCPDEDAEVP